MHLHPRHKFSTLFIKHFVHPCKCVGSHFTVDSLFGGRPVDSNPDTNSRWPTVFKTAAATQNLSAKSSILFGLHGRIRTYDILIPSQGLYQTELRTDCLVEKRGIEPRNPACKAGMIPISSQPRNSSQWLFVPALRQRRRSTGPPTCWYSQWDSNPHSPV